MVIGRIIKKGFQSIGYNVGRSATGLEIFPLSRVGVDALRDIATLRFSSSAPSVVLDVGANRGQSAIDLRRVFADAVIHSFEPDPLQFAKINPEGRDTKLLKHNTAVGEEDGQIDLILATSSEGNSVLQFDENAPAVLGGGWTVQKNSIRVPIMRIDTFCDRNGVDHIDILKSDTQGNELQVLAGAGEFLRPERVSVVLVEAIFRPMYKGQSYFSDIFVHLTQRGFRLVSFYNESRDVDGSIVWCDALFFGSR
jgi:FkbM family methyltransferase